jgi:hypothetical protein
VTVSQYTESFHITNSQLNSGLRMEDLITAKMATGNINGQDMHPGIQRFKSRADILTDDTARVGKDKSYLEDNGVIAKTVTDAVVAALANHSGGLPVKVVGTD